MKFLMKAGTAATMSFLLCSSVKCSPANAAELTRILGRDKNLSEAATQISGQKLGENTNSVDQKVPVNPEQSTTGSIKEIAKMLPENTSLVGIFSTKVSTWENLNRFQLFKMAGDAITKFIPPGTNLDSIKDIQSWLGDQAVIALMPKVGSAPVSLEESSVIIIPIKDMAKVQPFIDLLTSNKANTTEREYKGVKIQEIKTPEPPVKNQPSPKKVGKVAVAPKKPLPTKKPIILAIATVPGYVFTANSSKPIERVIDMRAGGIPNLAESPRFQPTLQNPEIYTTLFGIYENIPEFVLVIKDIYDELLTQIPQTEGVPLPPNPFNDQNLATLKEYSSINGFLTQQPDGLRFQVNTYRETPKPDNGIETTNQTEAILSRLPGTTYTSFSGRNLNFVWQTINVAFSAEPELKKGLDGFRKFFKTNTGLDFDKDVMGWMDGEYAIFAYPTKGGFIQSFFPNFNLGIGIAIQTNNRSVADKTIKKLTEVSKLKTHETQIKGQAITSIDLEDKSQSLLAYSWMEDNTIILTTGKSAIADLVPQPKTPLTTNYNFITATKSFPRPNQGYFYLNMGSVLSWAYAFVPVQYSKDPNFQIFKQAIGSVYSISSTSTAEPLREEFDILMVLAPVRNTDKK